MNTHNKKMLKNIQYYCQEYLEQKIDLPSLQSKVDGTWSNLENDVDKALRDKIFCFIETLEGIRFERSEDKHFELTSHAIASLNSAINNAINSQLK